MTCLFFCWTNLTRINLLHSDLPNSLQQEGDQISHLQADILFLKTRKIEVLNVYSISDV